MKDEKNTPVEGEEEQTTSQKTAKKPRRTAKTFREVRDNAEPSGEEETKEKTAKKAPSKKSENASDPSEDGETTVKKRTSRRKSNTAADTPEAPAEETAPEAPTAEDETVKEAPSKETQARSEDEGVDTDGEGEEPFDPEAFPIMSRYQRFGTRVKVITVWLLRKLWHRIKNIQMTDTRMIALSVAGVVLVGALLLCTPWASKSGEWTPFIDALFTATTSTCVTGLVTLTTAAHWSLFGQIVILVLIQVGGIGFMTVLTLISFFMHRQITMHERRLLQQSVGSINRSGVTGTFLQILLGTFVIEAIGAALLSIRFYPKYGGKGIWYAVFHSVSAFCNAGIDLLSPDGSSLIPYANDYLVTGTVMFLVIMGGLGFLVWNDILRCGIHFKKMKLHSKMVLTLTFGLILGGAIVLFLTERNAAFAGMSTGDRLWSALFQSVTLRTAGFATVSQTALSNAGALIGIILMFIGGSPGSTAGGVKTTTVAVFLISILRLSRNREDVVVFRKRIYNRIVRQAGAVVGVYLGMALLATIFICILEPQLGIREISYEVVSAIATVGLSMDVTPTLGAASKLILIILMYTGRLGGLSLFLALGEKTEAAALERPTENILIG